VTRRSTWTWTRVLNRAVGKASNGAQDLKAREGEERSDGEGKIKGLLVWEVK